MTCSTSGHQEMLSAEQAEFDDILMGDFDESFYNLTFKDSLLFTWAIEACHVKFVFKGTRFQKFKIFLRILFFDSIKE